MGRYAVQARRRKIDVFDLGLTPGGNDVVVALPDPATLPADPAAAAASAGKNCGLRIAD
jgi:hypothetical protein